MAEFGWAFISGAVTGKGAADAVQFIKTANGQVTGSSNFKFNSSTNSLFLTGTMAISGTLQAHSFDVIQTNTIEINQSGSTNFGNDSADTHVLTGSFIMISGGVRQHYYNLKSTTYSVNSYDSIIGVSSSAYVSITLPSASVAGAGRILIIKDESATTRSDVNKIAVSASGGEKIDRETTYSLSGDNPALTLYCNGVNNWFIY